MMNILKMITCGNLGIGFDYHIPNVISSLIDIIKIIVPIILIIFGMLDLGKIVISKKEDDMKKHQSMFIKRIIMCALVFLVISFTEMLVSFVAPNEKSSIVSCMDCFLNGKCTTFYEKME